MHWTSPFFIAQVIQLAVIIILVRGIILIIIALRKIEEKFRKPFYLILASFLVYILLAIAFSILISRNTDYESYLWVIPPAIGLLGSFVLIFGGNKLLKALVGQEANSED